MTESRIEILAWYKYPEPNGTNYTKNDLSKESEVTQVFEYCKIREATILSKGWEFLFNEYGLAGLIKIDSESGWMQDEDMGDRISGIIYQSLITGYHPLIKDFGDYDESESLFLLNDNTKLKVDWKEIYELKHTLNSP